MLGILTVHNFDSTRMGASVSAAKTGDELIVFSERGAGVVSVARHTFNLPRAYASHALLVSAHDDRPHMQPLLYQAVAQQPMIEP